MALLELIPEAIGNLLLHKTRSLLAVLGIVFGVASVICMLSISEVARQDVVRRIERMGINNVILDTVEPEGVRSADRVNAISDGEASVVQYGITRQDLKILEKNVAAIRKIVPMATKAVEVSGNQKSANTNVVGTSPSYTDVMSHPVHVGRFITAVDERNLTSICVLGSTTARDLFPLIRPIGQLVKIDDMFFKVVGILEQKGETGAAGKLSDPDKSIYLPYATAYSRFGLGGEPRGGQPKPVEINRAVLQVKNATMLEPVSQIATNMLARLHKQEDFSVTIPHSLLNEQKQSEQIFRWVMGSLAAISLLVGGIGIMNIMLANTTERKSEIGLRRALGATRQDVASLFISESLLLCIFGGALGVAVGYGLAQLIGSLAEWTVVYHTWSIPLGIVVSAIVGLVFGTIPAIRAAQQDPVLALRSE